MNVSEAMEDNDARKERDNVYKVKVSDYPLICKDLRMVYQSNIAVKSFCVAVEKGEIFGLLGPNGAGKTSIISAITGLFACNDGDAFVGGMSIRNQMQAV